MDPLLKKLNHRAGVHITVLRPPAEMENVVHAWATETTVRRRLGRQESFVLAFVRSCAEIAERAPTVTVALGDDAVLWFAYPKKSSRRYRSDIGRDDSWQILGELGFEGVRQVALDDDWSALRFRRPEHIDTLTRDRKRALSKAGRARTVPKP